MSLPREMPRGRKTCGTRARDRDPLARGISALDALPPQAFLIIFDGKALNIPDRNRLVQMLPFTFPFAFMRTNDAEGMRKRESLADYGMGFAITPFLHEAHIGGDIGMSRTSVLAWNKRLIYGRVAGENAGHILNRSRGADGHARPAEAAIAFRERDIAPYPDVTFPISLRERQRAHTAKFLAHAHTTAALDTSFSFAANQRVGRTCGEIDILFFDAPHARVHNAQILNQGLQFAFQVDFTGCTVVGVPGQQ
jgi:hypothetical protein